MSFFVKQNIQPRNNNGNILDSNSELIMFGGNIIIDILSELEENYDNRKQIMES